MGYSIVIWAKKKVSQEKTLLDLTRAAYRSGFSFSLHKVEKKSHNRKMYLVPYSFQIPPQKEGQEWLSFSFAPIQEQTAWVNLDKYFFNQNGNVIVFDKVYRLTTTDNVDAELSFHLIYEYLKINKDHLVDIDFLIDWPLMQKIHSEGYSETWCWRKQ